MVIKITRVALGTSNSNAELENLMLILGGIPVMTENPQVSNWYKTLKEYVQYK